MRAQEAADADGDGTVTQAETRAYAMEEGNRRVDPADEARLLAYLTLDLDGDGRLTLAELDAAARAAASRPGKLPDKDA
jgi:Ca2+-binding EF-hand superfamily protein